MCTSPFYSQVYKTMLCVLNFDVNTVNIALVAFCSLTDVEFTLMRVAGLYFATVVVCFSFALGEFSLKRFLIFFDCFVPAGVI